MLKFEVAPGANPTWDSHLRNPIEPTPEHENDPEFCKLARILLRVLPRHLVVSEIQGGERGGRYFIIRTTTGELFWHEFATEAEHAPFRKWLVNLTVAHGANNVDEFNTRVTMCRAIRFFAQKIAEEVSGI